MVDRATLMDRVVDQLAGLNEIVLEMVDVIEHLTDYIKENPISEPATEEELDVLLSKLDSDEFEIVIDSAGFLPGHVPFHPHYGE